MEQRLGLSSTLLVRAIFLPQPSSSARLRTCVSSERACCRSWAQPEALDEDDIVSRGSIRGCVAVSLVGMAAGVCMYVDAWLKLVIGSSAAAMSWGRRPVRPDGIVSCLMSKPKWTRPQCGRVVPAGAQLELVSPDYVIQEAC